MEINKIYNESCIDTMARMPDGFVDLSVTSPPYDNLRDYKGYCFDFENVAKELFRVTKQGGVVVWVVGDATIKGSETGTSFKQALYFKDVGFNLHDTMIYQKSNPIPQNHNRYEQSFEYMFVFSKGKPKTFNPIKEGTKNKGKSFDWGDRKTIMDDNQCRRDRPSEIIEVKPLKNKFNVFTYSVGGGKTGHPAVFPEQLANDHIISWSNEGDLVYDPFMGSGTTAKMALLNNRKFVGSEIAKEYFKIAEKRINENL
jgi:DNA modification methylase